MHIYNEITPLAACGSRGGGGGQRVKTAPHMKKTKKIGFLSNSVPDPMEDHKATKPAFNFEPQSALERNVT